MLTVRICFFKKVFIGGSYCTAKATLLFYLKDTISCQTTIEPDRQITFVNKGQVNSSVEMTQLEKIILGLLVLYCCFMIFRISANAGFFFLPLLLVLPPIIFRKKDKKKNSKQGHAGAHATTYPQIVVVRYFEGCGGCKGCLYLNRNSGYLKDRFDIPLNR